MKGKRQRENGREREAERTKETEERKSDKQGSSEKDRNRKNPRDGRRRTRIKEEKTKQESENKAGCMATSAFHAQSRHDLIWWQLHVKS